MILSCIDILNSPPDNGTMLLSQLKKNTRAKIIGFAQGQQHYRCKLLAMGLTPGCQFQVVRVAPLGDPIQINVRGFHLSLRKTEAKAVKIELIK